MYTAAPALSIDALRFVRCEKSLERAIAQHAMTLAQLPKREQHARETGNAAIAQDARETVAAWAFRIQELGGVAEVKPACCAHCGAVVKAKSAAKPVRSERVQAMRRFYAVAASHRLSTKNAQAMTVALSRYFAMTIPSRSVLAAGHWCEAAAAVELGLLAF